MSLHRNWNPLHWKYTNSGMIYSKPHVGKQRCKRGWMWGKTRCFDRVVVSWPLFPFHTFFESSWIWFKSLKLSVRSSLSSSRTSRLFWSIHESALSLFFSHSEKQKLDFQWLHQVLYISFFIPKASIWLSSSSCSTSKYDLPQQQFSSPRHRNVEEWRPHNQDSPTCNQQLQTSTCFLYDSVPWDVRKFQFSFIHLLSIDLSFLLSKVLQLKEALCLCGQRVLHLPSWLFRPQCQTAPLYNCCKLVCSVLILLSHLCLQHYQRGMSESRNDFIECFGWNVVQSHLQIEKAPLGIFNNRLDWNL